MISGRASGPSSMTKITFDITMSLDGFIAGPNQTLEAPLGEGGERLHEWVVGVASWRERHGLEGGDRDADDELVRESIASVGAQVMGRRMFSGGSGAWKDDPNADGWWGDDPPFRAPVFVLTHHPREPVEKQGGTSYTFVTDGIESAVEQARAAAGGKNVLLAGGASVIQQALRAGLVDEFQVHVAPMLLGGGVRLFADDGPTLDVERTRVVESPRGVAHVSYRVVR
jgi:dihydrofolate reductase